MRVRSLGFTLAIAVLASTAIPCRGESVGGRHWVYFSDKGVSGAALSQRLEDLAASLPQRTIQRRMKTMGTAFVDAHDVPVRREYVDAVRSLGAAVHHESRWLNAVSVRASADQLGAIARLSFVLRVEPVRGGPGRSPLPDAPAPLEVSGTGLYDYGPSFGQLDEIGVIAAHDQGLTGAGVVVCMMDSGFWLGHPAIQPILQEGRLLGQYDFVNNDADVDDPNSIFHGTATWTALAGFAPGKLIGPAFGASFLLAKTEDVNSETPVEEDNWVAAAEWAEALGADVFSTSLVYVDWYMYADMDGETAPITIASDLAAHHGVVVCNSAGNYATEDWYYIGAPADGNDVIAVGAVSPNNVLADFSSHGPTFDGRIKPDVVARGESVACGQPGDPGADYGSHDGTSLSCPLVGGSAALLLEAHPTWTPSIVREALRTTADHAQNPNNDVGWGRIDVAAALVAPGPDGDADGVGGFQDCDDANDAVWATPGEVGTLLFSPGGQTLSWTPPPDLGGRSVVYDTLRSGAARDFVTLSVCVETNGTDTSSTDMHTPAPQAVFFYLVRAGNSCPSGRGSLGEDSNGVPREGRSCP